MVDKIASRGQGFEPTGQGKNRWVGISHRSLQMVVPLGISSLAFGKNTLELPQPARESPTEPVQAGEHASKRGRPDVYFANRPQDASADVGDEHRHKRRTMHVDAVS